MKSGAGNRGMVTTEGRNCTETETEKRKRNGVDRGKHRVDQVPSDPSGMIVTSALIIWKALMCITGSESPVVVVLSGSMEPGFKRGDILFLHMSKDPIRAGEIVVFNVDVHERQDTGEVEVLTKGDNNYGDDRLLYAQGQLWLKRQHIMGRAVGSGFGAPLAIFGEDLPGPNLALRFLPYVGWVTIIMTEKPIIKYILIGALGLLVITSKD
ncbi:DNA-directed RNA polymerase III subunit RPC6 [Citrus sinensis]|uniref:DNA-directed RNA polymerase III subunit RPC6 n=2 Tax=Citrus sinensis TaxID=2711 RepID=A0ACB8JB31_CITSI|nr:DNA-directed RNA polymerase III subunit RPC6 [Citrus sinensis]